MAINQVEQQPAYPGHFIERNLSNVRESSNNKAHYFFFLLKSITSRWHIQRQTVLVKYRSIVCEWRHESKSHGAPTCFRARVSACNTFGTSSFKVFGTAPTFRPFARNFLFSGRNDAKNYAHRRIDGDQNRSCEKEKCHSRWCHCRNLSLTCNSAALSDETVGLLHNNDRAKTKT